LLLQLLAKNISKITEEIYLTLVKALDK